MNLVSGGRLDTTVLDCGQQVGLLVDAGSGRQAVRLSLDEAVVLRDWLDATVRDGLRRDAEYWRKAANRNVVGAGQNPTD